MQDLGQQFIKTLRSNNSRQLPIPLGIILPSYRKLNTHRTCIEEKQLKQEEIFSITNVSTANWTLMYSKSWSNWCIPGVMLAFNNLILTYTPCEVVHNSFYNI